MYIISSVFIVYKYSMYDGFIFLQPYFFPYCF